MPGEAISESMYLTIGYLEAHSVAERHDIVRLTMRRCLTISQPLRVSNFGFGRSEFAGLDGVTESTGFVGAVAERFVLGLTAAAET